ncbi:zinc transporter ZupT [Poriferisphaera corsica]|uniref:Zinc transporter ZupT n=1 Tax=Poriferisphaera corsica TaxID=2528020 RepID=A0A517YWC2_9BACT|nr:ZIP family metal transporter [Poriferisphaera corsica]QDU34530.1 zinc transporter ZupT [Poriferisphaera corsica]
MNGTLYFYLSVYCVLILLVSLFGGIIPMMVKLTHRRMQFAISCVAGFILGIAVLILLPGSFESLGEAFYVANWVIAGMLVMFFLERFFCFHHHDVDDANIDHASCKDAPEGIQAEVDRHKQGECGCAHEHHHGQSVDGNEQISLTAHEHKLTWSGAAIGLTLHSIIAGVALAAAMAGEGESGRFWPGIAVFLVIVLHKPFDSMTLGTLMAASGWSKGWRHIVNGLFALAVPLGAVLFLLGVGGGSDVHANAIVGGALAFSAGVFLVVSLSDLLPEIQFHHHDRLGLTAALLLGLALAYGVVLFGHSKMHGEDDGHNHGANAAEVHVGEMEREIHMIGNQEADVHIEAGEVDEHAEHDHE